MEDLFRRYPWLPPPDRWHPEASARIAEARELASNLGPEVVWAEVWAFLGALTQADVDARHRASNALCDLMRAEPCIAGWPALARCLARLGSAEVPGRFWAAQLLMELYSEARARDLHRDLLPVDWLELRLGLWNDEGRRPFRDAIRRSAVSEAGRPTHEELLAYDVYLGHAERAERSLAR